MTASHSRKHLYDHADTGARIADQVAALVGSWPFVIGQAVLLALWMAWNALAPFFLRYDQFPFVFLNLFMSAEAAFATPIILMSQNRAAARDQKRDDHEAAEVDQLFTINQQQITILNQQTEILNLLRQRAPSSAPEPAPVTTPAPPIPIKRRSRARKADTADAR